MPGYWKRPVGRGLGVCHDPNKWRAYIPILCDSSLSLEVEDQHPQDSYTAVILPDKEGKPVAKWVEKALLCDLAWAILKQFEVPHIQDELLRLERKANY